MLKALHKLRVSSRMPRFPWGPHTLAAIALTLPILIFGTAGLRPGLPWADTLPGNGEGASPAKGGTGAIGVTVPIPGGTGWLGSGEREKGFGYTLGGEAAWRGRWFHSERRRQVTLPPFRMDRTLVTQQAYARFVTATGRRTPFISRAGYIAQGFLVHPYASVLPYLWRGGISPRPPAGREAHPVVLVSQGDAAAYCQWRGRSSARDNMAGGYTGRNKTGSACRLPSEDEWEWAARGSDRRYFPWGFSWEPARVNTSERGPYGTTPVLAYPGGRTPTGLHDMAGNVFQWTSTPAAGLGQTGRIILKGCSWDDLGGICRAAARHGRPAKSRHILIGFRCLCAAEGIVGAGGTEGKGK